MGDVVHLRKGRSLDRLGEISDEVYQQIDFMCLKVGELLHEARQLLGSTQKFDDWVEAEMPFGFDKARRLMAIYVAYKELPVETLQQMPRPWQALYALRQATPERLQAAIESGEIGPDTTVRQARDKAREWNRNGRKPDSPANRYSMADIRAGALMDCDPDDLDDNVFKALVRWAAGRQSDTSPAQARSK